MGNSITIEQLIDIIQADLTMSGLFPKVLPDIEIYRIIKEQALEWFYKNYQFSVIKAYYYMDLQCFKTEVYTKYKYFVLPEEIENIVRIVKVDDPSLFHLGIQAPHLSINLGVTNQPFLTSFVTTVGDLAVYRSVISAFSDEINKMNKQSLKFRYNHINKRLHILTKVDTDLVFDVYVRIEPEELFDFHLFKDYVIGLSRIRLGEAIGRFNFNMPGNFQYNANDMITQGQVMVDKVIEKIKSETQSGWFFMSR
ncbi:MAG: hypothetical protein HPY57_15655 [Ignavibacteria bacterium]|nr:hypothetical protein [Ignavibacteria bacterium]